MFLGISTENWLIIAGALFAISEALALIPTVKANSIFQFIQNGLKKLLGKA